VKAVDYVVLIPSNFGASPVVRLWANRQPSSDFVQTLQDVLTRDLRTRFLASQGLSPAAAQNATSIAPALSISTPPPGGGAREAMLMRSILPLAASYLLMISLMLSGSWMLQGTVEERSNKLLETVLACVSPEELMYGKLLGTAGVGLFMIVVWIGCGLFAAYATQGAIADFIRPALDPLTAPGTILAMIYFFIVGYVAIAILFLAIGAMSDSMRDAQGYLMPVIMLILLPITLLMQAVLAGGMDIGYSPGLNAVLAAYAQGNKLKVVSAEFLGQNDTFFYVPKDSPIKSTKDLNGKSVAFPRPGGASEALLLAFKSDSKLDFKPVATGGMDATMTMTMTKQVDVGYSIPPSGLAAVDEGKIRVLFAGDDVKSQADITGRVIVVKADYLAKNRAVVAKFLETLDKCIDWAYANKAESSKFYGELNKVDAKIAEKGIAFYNRKTLAFGPIKGMDQTMKQAVEGKFISKPLTEAELKDLVDIVYTTKK